MAAVRVVCPVTGCLFPLIHLYPAENVFQLLQRNWDWNAQTAECSDLNAFDAEA